MTTPPRVGTEGVRLGPLISVVMAVYDVAQAWLERAIGSVLNQSWPP